MVGAFVNEEYVPISYVLKIKIELELLLMNYLLDLEKNGKVLQNMLCKKKIREFNRNN